MENNIFLKDTKEYSLDDYMNYNGDIRRNLGDSIPLAVYRLLEFSMREELSETYGHETQVKLFRGAGYRAGVFFAKHFLDLTLPMNEFISELQSQMNTLKIGVLRIEDINPETGKIVLTVSEDADCSGLPILGQTVCNYDEGFISGILSTYTGTFYSAVEVDCWATGDRVCRFHVTKEDDPR